LIADRPSEELTESLEVEVAGPLSYLSCLSSFGQVEHCSLHTVGGDVFEVMSLASPTVGDYQDFSSIDAAPMEIVPEASTVLMLGFAALTAFPPRNTRSDWRVARHAPQSESRIGVVPLVVRQFP
jgi:hypothetical protein